MMPDYNRFDFYLKKWALQELHDAYTGGSFPSISSVERVLSDPGVATYGSKDKILWEPVAGTNMIHKAAHQLSGLEKIVLMVDTGVLRDSEDKVIDKRAFLRLMVRAEEHGKFAQKRINSAEFDRIKRHAKKVARKYFYDSSNLPPW
jgi:hypothetical protein